MVSYEENGRLISKEGERKEKKKEKKAAMGTISWLLCEVG